MTKKKAPAQKRSRGRPSDFRPEYVEQAYKLALLGATDAEIADFFGKNADTIYAWKKNHPEFSESIRAGKLPADSEVASRFFDRACGASWIEEVAIKVKTTKYEDGRKTNESEEIKVVPLRKQAPPDTRAGEIWLQNRQPDKWRASGSQLPKGASLDALTRDDTTIAPDEPIPANPIL